MSDDLEIEIRDGDAADTFEVSVTSPAGAATGTMRLAVREVLDRRRELAASVLASAVANRSGFPTLERPVRDVGQELFEALFTGHVYGRYTASLQEAAIRGEPLRVVLRLRAEQLAGIPWETMFDSESREYLCQREPVVRYVDAPQASSPLVTAGPLRVLGMVAAPRDLVALDTKEERRRLEAALKDLRQQALVEMVWVEGGHWAALQQALMGGPWHALHFIGHGGIGAEGGVLALEDETTGNAAMVSANRFARLLHACRPVPRLVVLNSCSSGEAAADDLLSSTAAALVHSGISATVAMQFAVTDPAALAFSRGFYQALAHNIPVDEAVRLGRIAINGTSEQTLEWVTPVIYLRTDDTRLFDLTSSGRAPAAATATEAADIAGDAARYGLYVEALAALRTERYDEAVALFDSLITLEPDYRDAVERRDAARRAQRAQATYAEARAAEDRKEWEVAARGYREVLGIDETHREARVRAEACQRRLDAISLRDELRVHARGGDWAMVTVVGEELARIDPDSADPEGLVSHARSVLASGAGTTPAGSGVTAPPGATDVEAGTTEVSVEDEVATIPPQRSLAPSTDPDLDLDLDLDLDPETEPESESEPTPADLSGSPSPEQSERDEHTPRRWWLLAAAAVATLVVAGGGVLLLQDRESPGTSPGASRGGVTEEPGGSTDPVTCWEGSSADAPADCPQPQGRAGLTAVFPSLDESCTEGNADGAELMTGKAELFECDFGAYTVRYSRWEDDFDRFQVLENHSHGAQSKRWRVDGVAAGQQWVGGVDEEADDGRGYRWMATYEAHPYDVVIRAENSEALAEGMASVQAKPPGEIGLS